MVTVYSTWSGGRMCPEPTKYSQRLCTVGSVGMKQGRERRPALRPKQPTYGGWLMAMCEYFEGTGLGVGHSQMPLIMAKGHAHQSLGT